MRFASLFVILALAGVAQAQTSTIWGGTPRNLTYTPIDTSKAIGASNLNTAFRTPSYGSQSPLNFSNMFRGVTLPSWPPKSPQVSMMPQTQNAYQPNGVKGGFNPFSPPPTKKK